MKIIQDEKKNIHKNLSYCQGVSSGHKFMLGDLEKPYYQSKHLFQAFECIYSINHDFATHFQSPFFQGTLMICHFPNKISFCSEHFDYQLIDLQTVKSNKYRKNIFLMAKKLLSTNK